MSVQCSYEVIDAALSTALRSAVPGLAIEVVALTGSTNADLLARVDQLHAPVLRIATQQSAGRGRGGRSWHSAAGASLTFSLAWRFELPLQALSGLPLAVGVAIAETLMALSLPVQLKWPNDIFLDGEKLAGILIETAHARTPAAPLWAIIGIGINLQPSVAVSEQVAQPVASLTDSVAPFDVNQLMASLLERLCATLQTFEAQGFAAFNARWNALHLHRGQAVKIVDQGRTVQSGIADGVDDHGRLLLDTAQGRRAIVAGDVSLRALEG